ASGSGVKAARKTSDLDRRIQSSVPVRFRSAALGNIKRLISSLEYEYITHPSLSKQPSGKRRAGEIRIRWLDPDRTYPRLLYRRPGSCIRAAQLNGLGDGIPGWA